MHFFNKDDEEGEEDEQDGDKKDEAEIVKKSKPLYLKDVLARQVWICQSDDEHYVIISIPVGPICSSLRGDVLTASKIFFLI